MAEKTLQKHVVQLLIVIVALAALYVVANTVLFDATRSYYNARFLEEQQLQLEQGASAVRESLAGILSESSVLASYSFREFEEGQRTPESIERLLSTELETYPDVALYAYYELPGTPTIEKWMEGMTGHVAISLSRDAISRNWRAYESSPPEGPGETRIVDPIHAGPVAQLASFGYPVFADNAFQGVLHVVVDIASVADKYIAKCNPPEGCSVLMVDDRGIVMWTAEDRPHGTHAASSHPFVSRLPSRSAGHAAVSAEGEQYFAAWSTVPFGESQFRLIRATAASQTLPVPAHITAWRIGTNSLLLLVLLLAFAYTVRLYLGQRKHHALEQNRSALLRRLSFQKERFEAVTNRYELLFDKANDGIFILRDGVVIECNQRAGELFGLPVEELIGLRPNDFSPEFQPDGRASSDTASEHIRATEEGVPQLFEWDHLDSKGKGFTAEISLSRIEVADEVLVQAFIRDVTERKRMQQRIKASLDERTVMLQEIHHRVNNNLQLISSLLSLESGQEGANDTPGTVRKTQRRIFALSHAHETMYRQQDLSAIDLAEYLVDLVHQSPVHENVTGKRVLCSVQPVQCSLERALPIGLIASELVDNAFVHAVPRVDEGVEIRLDCEQHGPKQLWLVVADNGFTDGGVDLSRDKGLGLTIVDTLAQQLGATLELDSNDGVVVRLVIPLT